MHTVHYSPCAPVDDAHECREATGQSPSSVALSSDRSEPGAQGRHSAAFPPDVTLLPSILSILLQQESNDAAKLDDKFITDGRYSALVAGWRGVVVKWLSQCAFTLDMSTRTVCMAMRLFDRTLAAAHVADVDIQRYGIMCLLLAAKLNEPPVPGTPLPKLTHVSS
jgi:hypothetical protein